MNKFKKLLIAIGVVLALGTLSVTAIAAGTFGSSAVEVGATYTLTQMLTYAVQDEELAYAQYVKIDEALGNPRPFANIVKAEQIHIAALEKLATAQGINLPDNTANTQVTVPADITEALNAGIQAEKNNIAMYTQFLSQALSDDVKAVFTALKNASEHHLAAFERSLSGTPSGPAQNGNGSQSNGNRGYGANGSGACNGTGTGRMNNGQNKGQNGTGTCTGACLLQG